MRHYLKYLYSTLIMLLTALMLSCEKEEYSCILPTAIVPYCWELVSYTTSDGCQLKKPLLRIDFENPLTLSTQIGWWEGTDVCVGYYEIKNGILYTHEQYRDLKEPNPQNYGKVKEYKILERNEDKLTLRQDCNHFDDGDNPNENGSNAENWSEDGSYHIIYNFIKKK